MAALFSACEACGDWFPDARSMALRLLPKASGGYRTVALFRGLYRVYAKARQEAARRWAAERLSAATWNNMAGRRPGDVVWRAAVRSRLAASRGREMGEILLDLSKMFDRVHRPTLLAIAQQEQYPVWLLRISLASYEWERHLLGEAGLVEAPVLPRLSVAAGSSFAVFEVALMLLPMVTEASRSFPQAQISLHVDDLAVGAEAARGAQVAQTVVGCGRWMVATLEGPLRHKVARDKTAVVGSSRKLIMMIIQGMGDVAADCERGEVRRLGIDYALQRHRRSKVQRARLKAYRLKLRRLRALARAKRLRRRGKLGHVFQAGLVPGALYGAEVVQPPQQALRGLRHQAARCRGISRPHAPPGLVWCAEPRGLDPAAQAAWMALERYAREWYGSLRTAENAGYLRAPELVAAFRLAQGGRRRSSGPIEGALRAVGLAGWSFVNATTIEMQGGRRFMLTIGSPRLLRRFFFAEFARAQATEAAKLRCRQQGGPAAGFADGDGRPSWLCFDDYRRVLYGAGRNALSASQQHWLRGLVTNSMVTGEVLQAWGVLHDGRCLHCGAMDSWHHRLHECDQAQWLRDELRFGELRAALTRGADGWMVDRGWFWRQILPEQHRDEGLLRVLGEAPAEGPFFDPAGGPVFLDGSCLHPRADCAVAACAAVQARPDGGLLRGLARAVPWDFPQEAACSEHLAFLTASANLGGRTVCFSDCAGVVSAFAKGRAFATSERRPWASFWAEADWSQVQGVLKVKAHRAEPSREEAPEDWSLWAGNELADECAKEQARLSLPPPGVVTEMLAVHRDRTAYLRAAARILDLWPTTRELIASDPANRVLVRQARARVAAARQVQEHVLVWCQHRRVFICAHCCRFSRSVGTLAGKRCSVLHGEVRSRVEVGHAMGHHLHLASGGGASRMLFCGACGCYAELAMVGLGRPCRGRLSGQRAKLSRLAAGVHPVKRGVLFERVERVLPLAAATADVQVGHAVAPAPLPARLPARDLDDPDRDPFEDLGGSEED